MSKIILPKVHNIIITGTNCGVGKTSLIRRFAGNKFMYSYNPTHAFQKYTFTIIKKHLNHDDKLIFNIYDTYTTFDVEDFIPLKTQEFPTTSIIMCSKLDAVSLSKVKYMKNLMKEISDYQIVICNKCDTMIDNEDIPSGVIPMSIKMNLLPFSIYPFNILGYGTAQIVEQNEYE